MLARGPDRQMGRGAGSIEPSGVAQQRCVRVVRALYLAAFRFRASRGSKKRRQSIDLAAIFLMMWTASYLGV